MNIRNTTYYGDATMQNMMYQCPTEKKFRAGHASTQTVGQTELFLYNPRISFAGCTKIQELLIPNF